jgi:immune inhibitor A
MLTHIHSCSGRLTHLLIIGLLASVIALAGLAPVYGAPPAQGGTLDLIETTTIPPRDPIDLARRLRGVTDIPAPPVTAQELEVGDVLTFWADNNTEDYSFQLDAELVYKTDHVYMFIEVGFPVDRTAVKLAADTFENEIRPRVHEVFGTEWTPGIDGDPHLVILNASRLGSWVAGYWGNSSEYPVEAVPTSNEHEMFFINADNMLSEIGTDYYEKVLAHEFQHMVHWKVDPNETSWINEGLSELARLLCGYPGSERVVQFLQQPNIQLTTWPENGDRGLSYGAAFAFAAYFYQRFGETATTALVQDPANGMISVENTLRAINATDPLTGQPVYAADLFGDWVVTNWLLNAAYGDGRYGYTLPGFDRLPPAAITASLPLGSTQSLAAPQWGANYLYLDGRSAEQSVRIVFDGQDTVPVVPADAHSGRYMWWSNRADNSDMRLTRAFDLTGVDSATLTYWAWYHIEELWDYGYVMVSTDGGVTWTPLSAARTTTANPHNNAYGPGYTGASSGWVQETVDLSAYAGQNILLRFEYMTDDAVNQPGLLIDDVSIPQIGYADDFERGAGDWIAEGWLLMDNVLPQQFLVQVIQTSNPAAPVTRLLGPDDAPQGDLTITVGGDAGDAVVVVAGLAPVTTEPARYSITAVSVESVAIPGW